MKTLERMNNVEKAKLLHQLFPEEIPALIEYVQGMCHAIIVDEPTQRENWDLGILSFDMWLRLVRQADGIVKQYGTKLNASNRLFADQLFDGYLAIYMVHCLTTYATTAASANKKLPVAIDLLFNP